MFRTSNAIPSPLQRSTQAALFVLLTLFAATGAFGLDCSSAVPLDLDSTLRAYESESDAAHLFSVDLPSPGIVTLDVSVIGFSRSLPRLALLNDRCESSRFVSGAIAILEQTAYHLVLAAQAPGTYYLRAGAQDPHQALGDYKIRLGFEAAEVEEESFELGLAAKSAQSRRQISVHQVRFFATAQTDKTEEETTDPDPGSKRSFSPSFAQGQLIASLATLRPLGVDKTEEETTDPDPGTKTEEETTDPDPGKRLAPRSFAEISSARLVLFQSHHGPQLAKTEEETTDPDPGAKTEEETTDPDPGVKTEEETTDPDPGSKGAVSDRLFYGFVTVAATRSKTEEETTDPDPGKRALGLEHGPIATFRISERGFTSRRSEADVLGAADLERIAELIWPGAWSLVKSNDEDFRVTSFGGPGEVSSPRFAIAAGCRHGELDDHGDSFACASHLAASVSGQISNGWGDDSDVFTFTLDELTTLEIRSSGATATFGEVFDSSGRRLASDLGSGENANFRIVAAFEPGQYFIRVQGADQAEGDYRIGLESMDW